MFTGLIEEMGKVAEVERRPSGCRLWIAAAGVLDDTRPGQSLAVNGCCLTAVAVEPGRFAADVVPETFERTTLGVLQAGDPVNLERPLRLGDRLGGHLVQGHVDGVGVVRSVVPEGEGRRIAFELPDGLARFVAEKGSLAVDGASLTVASAKGARFEVAFVPHTLRVTLAGGYTPGRGVNLEVDLVARHIARLFDEAAVTRRPE